jgi:hypothetical protein
MRVGLLDLRSEPVDSLPDRISEAWRQAPRLLLTVSRRPGKRWTQGMTFARGLVLASAPLYELVLWIDRATEFPLMPAEALQDQEELLGGYQRLFSQESDVEAYCQLLSRHIEHQERHLFPQLTELAPVDRATRELCYEHRGLEKGIEALRMAISSNQGGRLSKKDKDRLDLDFFHLLEHHLERERDAVFPALTVLCKGKDSSLTKD